VAGSKAVFEGVFRDGGLGFGGSGPGGFLGVTAVCEDLGFGSHFQVLLRGSGFTIYVLAEMAGAAAPAYKSSFSTFRATCAFRAKIRGFLGCSGVVSAYMERSKNFLEFSVWGV